MGTNNWYLDISSSCQRHLLTLITIKNSNNEVLAFKSPIYKRALLNIPHALLKDYLSFSCSKSFHVFLFCFVLFFSKCDRLDWNKTEVLWYCIRSGWDAVSFLRSIPHSVVLCTGSSKAVDNTAVLWLPPSSAHTASRLSPQHSFPRMLGVGRILWGDISRTGDTNWSKGYAIPYDIYSAIKAKRKEVEGGHSLLRCLSSRASAMHTEALLPRNCLDITCWWQEDNKSFFLSFSSMHSLCFCFTKLP